MYANSKQSATSNGCLARVTALSPQLGCLADGFIHEQADSIPLDHPPDQANLHTHTHVSFNMCWGLHIFSLL